MGSATRRLWPERNELVAQSHKVRRALLDHAARLARRRERATRRNPPRGVDGEADEEDVHPAEDLTDVLAEEGPRVVREDADRDALLLGRLLERPRVPQVLPEQDPDQRRRDGDELDRQTAGAARRADRSRAG